MSGQTKIGDSDSAYLRDNSLCWWIVCRLTNRKAGGFRCTRCKGSDPETVYCSVECQTEDWKGHKKFCGKTAYTFEIELVGSSNPVITRIVDVPSWFTFGEFHTTIQYAMGPWQNSHLHEFTYPRQNRRGMGSNVALGIVMPEDRMDTFGDYAQINEETIKLEDIYDEDGKLRSKVEQHGEVPPVRYLYDMGDNWEHEITFKGEKLARAARPLFSKAIGYGPVEDCGGIPGWQDVKRVFGERDLDWSVSRSDVALT